MFLLFITMFAYVVSMAYVWRIDLSERRRNTNVEYKQLSTGVIVKHTTINGLTKITEG